MLTAMTAHSLYAVLMAQITIRNIDDAVIQALRRRAAAAGHSTEEEARRSLAMAAGVEREGARDRLEAVRQAIGRRQDESAEVLIRLARDARSNRL